MLAEQNVVMFSFREVFNGSYFFNGATGGCIVTLQTLVFLAAFLFAPKHGMLASQRRLGREATSPAP